MKKRPALIGYIILVLLIGVGLLRVEHVAANAAKEACDAFEQSKRVMVGIINTSFTPTSNPTTPEEQERFDAVEIRKKLLIAQIDAQGCE
jgi:hypothetical protein